MSALDDAPVDLRASLCPKIWKTWIKDQEHSILASVSEFDSTAFNIEVRPFESADDFNDAVKLHLSECDDRDLARVASEIRARSRAD